MLPRFFVPSPRAPEGEAHDDRPDEIDDVVASLCVRGVHGLTDVIVGLDVARRLHVVPASARRELGPKAQAQLATDELTRKRKLVVDADELWLMDVQQVEQPPDVPGLDDPVYLYGGLRGPFPAGLAAGARVFDGQLMTSRGALLEGLRGGVERAFVYAQGFGGSRFVHAAVPGEPAEVIARGRGIVLACLVPPRITLDDDCANEPAIAQLFYDLLRALRAELGDPEPLPVPDRVAHDKALAAEGWTVEGDRATRPPEGGRLRALFAATPTMELPRQGTLEEYRALAGLSLARIVGWPSPEVAALAARTRATIGLVAPAPPVAMPALPAGEPPVAPARAPRPRVSTPRTEWIQDFLEQRAAAPPPRPKPRRVVAPAPLPPSEPSWMRDFDAPAPIARTDRAHDAGESSEPDAPASAGTDDWRKDFE